ncbi:MAG: HAD family phosphatase [Chitinophagaceae bacterium]|nr:HAD family phosphatase [Chitinophagaceae bacterium]
MAGKIKNILLDLGGVLIDIDYNKPINAFNALGILHFEEMFSQVTANKLFEDLETGQITDEVFYETIKQLCPTSLTNQQIKTAWNSILLDFRPKSIAYLQTLMQQYNVYLLSNTNSIHQTAFQQLFTQKYNGKHLSNCFTKAYYSNNIHLRKPHLTIYEFVLHDAGINAAETLFIDDSAINIPPAQTVGMHTHLLLSHQTIEEVIPLMVAAI